jgi:CIC family chloride channel protein
MVGGAFGLIAAMPFPELASDQGAYTLIGMGAVAGAVLGAPISTILMIFELTGDYRMTIGVMVAVSIASIVTRSLHSPSFFADQLAARGLNLSGAYEAGLLKAMQVTEYMHDAPITVLSDAPLDDVRARLLAASPGPVFVVEANGSLSGIVSLADLGGAAFDTSNDDQLTAANVARKRPAVVAAGDDLQHALSVFEDTSEALIAVVDNDIDRQLIGSLQEQRVLRAYRLAMERMRAEEHGE